jgi:PAS domain S-box-containing protein
MGVPALKADEHDLGWVDLYHSALLEVDYQKLPERLKLAEDAIQARLRILPVSGGSEEMRHIQDARQNLRLLQQELKAHRSSTTDRISHAHSEIDGQYVVFVDANRRYVEVTDGVCQLLGYSREELLAKTIDEITAPELRAQVPEIFRQYINQGGLEGRHALLAKDGRRIPIRYESKVYPDGCRVARWQPLNQPQDYGKERAS